MKLYFKPIMKLLLIATVCLTNSTSFSQKKNTSKSKLITNAESSTGRYLGSTKAFRDMPDFSNPKIKSKYIKHNIPKARTLVGTYDELVIRNKSAVDPVWQKSKGYVNNEGVSFLENADGSMVQSPSDPTGDVDDKYYITGVNVTSFEIFDKETGDIVKTISGDVLWQPFNGNGGGDPIVLYHQVEKRWILTEFSSGGNTLYIATSKTSDPLGEYDVFSYNTPSFPDYPKYAFFKDVLMCSTNEPPENPMYIFNLNDIFNTVTSPRIQRLEPARESIGTWQMSQPVDWTGSTLPPVSTKPMALQMYDVSNKLEVVEFTVDWDNSSNSGYNSTKIQLAPFSHDICSASGSSFECLQGKGGSMDALPGALMFQSHYMNFGTHESIVYATSVDASGNKTNIGIRWGEIRKIGNNPWALYQEGTYAPEDGQLRSMPAICIAKNGSIGLAFDKYNSDTYPGIAYTGRRATDPLGEMVIEEFDIQLGSNSITGRHGDYAHMTLDPIDETTFWGTHEYGRGVKAYAFKITPAGKDLTIASIDAPLSSSSLKNNEAVTITISNIGADSVSSFDVGYFIDNGSPVRETINQTIQPGATLAYTFTSTADLSNGSEFKVTTFIDFDDDLVAFNDTTKSTVLKLLDYDAQFVSITRAGNENCQDSIEISMKITNQGFSNLTSAKISILTNDEHQKVVDWTGNLAEGESETITTFIQGLVDGTNNVSALISMPNGNSDENPVNNDQTFSFDYLVTGENISVEFIFDEYPTETSWLIKDDSSNILIQVGPFDEGLKSDITKVCVNKGACYTFEVTDAFNDGICCSEGNGSYSIKDENGSNLVISNGDYASGETKKFCSSAIGCNVVTQVVTTHADPNNNNASIEALASLGVPPYEYSIDDTNYQTLSTFSNLSPGIYTLFVKDATNCNYQTSFLIGTLGIDQLKDEFDLKLYPNPTDGFVSMSLKLNHRKEDLLLVRVLDVTGKVVGVANLIRYNDTYKGQIPFHGYAPGMYFIRLMDSNVNRTIPIVRK